LTIIDEIFKLKKLLRSRYVYLHVPRCAGSAIKRNIRTSPYEELFVLKHHDYSIRRLNFFDKRKKIFISIRNPFDWYYSVYSLKMSNPKRNLARGKTYSTMPNNTFAEFFYDVAIRANGIEGFSRWFQPLDSYQMEIFESSPSNIGFYTSMLAWYAQKDLRIIELADMNAENFRNSLCVDGILRMENLQNDFDDFLASECIRVDMSRKINMVGHDVKAGLAVDKVKAYDDIMKRLLVEYDALVFEAFGYKVEI